MKSFVLSICFCLIFAQLVSSQVRNLKLTSDFINGQLIASGEQYKTLISQVPTQKFPKTFNNDKQEFSNSSWWCSGFYPGTLLYLSEATGNQDFQKVALDKLKELEKEQFNKGPHDLGFMLFCSFGNALSLTGDSASYQAILKTGAASRSTTCNSNTKTIRSWDHNKWKFPL